MAFALARALLLADAVAPEAMAHALLVSASRGTSLVRALLATNAIDADGLEEHLERVDAPSMRHVAPVPALVESLPSGLCERLLALPVRRDARTGTVDVAVVDARDPHAVEEIGYWLRAPVRRVRTSLSTLDAALRRLHEKPEPGLRTLAAPMGLASGAAAPRPAATTPAYGGLASGAIEAEDDRPTDPSHQPDGLFAPDAPVDPNIPFPLQRRSLLPDPIIELREPAVEREAEPVLDLRRRKSSLPPAAPNAPRPPFPDVTPTLQAIRDATDRDTILELLVAGARTAARKVAVLAVKRQSLVGWTCSPELGDRAILRQTRVSTGGSGPFAAALEADVARLLRIPKDATHATLLAAMTAPPRGEVAVAAVKVDGRPVALLLADEIGDTMVATRRMEELARVAGESLGRLLRDKRRA